MRFEFSRSGDATVRVIPLIESYSLSRIEGRNGAGKSMAIRLLQLCTGEQPYGEGDGRAWRDLRDRLGDVTIRASELRGAGELSWRVDPQRWPEDVDPNPTIVGEANAICSEVTIDGRPADDAAVRKLLRVHRLVGDETLVESVEAEVRSTHATARRELDRLLQRVDGVRKWLDPLREALAASRVERVRNAERNVEEARKALAEAGAVVESGERRVEQVRDLRIRQARLERLRDEHPDPEAEKRDLERQLASLRERHQQVRSQRDALDWRSQADAALVAGLDEINGQIETLSERRESAALELAKGAAAAGLGGVALERDERPLQEAVRQAQQRVDRLQLAQSRVDATPQLEQLADEILTVLDSAVARRVIDLPIARITNGGQLTAGDLRDAVAVQREETERAARPPNAETLGNTLSDASAQLNSLKELQSTLRKLRRRTSDLQKLRERAGKLTSGLSGDQGAEYAALNRQLEELRGDIETADQERTALLQQMAQVASGTSLATLTTRLERDIADAALDEGRLVEELERAEGAARDAVSERREAELALEAAQAALAAAVAERTEALAALAGADAFRAVRESGFELPRAGLETDENDRRAKALLGALAAAESELDEAIAVASDQVVAALDAANAQHRPTQPGQLRVLELFQERLGAAYFGAESVARALFGGGELVKFDVLAHRITWRYEDGKEITRTLEAFSSGERAFAYTRARLERLRSEPRTSNRFVALDEFGAFLERARLQLLEQFLAEDVVGTFVDQAVIILPLSIDDPSVSSDGYITTPLAV
jgi:hypothetical protein